MQNLVLFLTIFTVSCGSATHFESTELSATKKVSIAVASKSADISSFVLNRSDIEDARHRSAKVAKLYGVNDAEVGTINRCHQYWTHLIKGIEVDEVVVCRDNSFEIVMVADYGEDKTRWARLKDTRGTDPVFFNCKQTSKKEFSKYLYGGTSVHRCETQTKVPRKVYGFFTQFDNPPDLDVGPTRTAIVPTKRDQGWLDLLAKSLPFGSYNGRGKTASAKCRVDVEKTDAGAKIKIVRPNEKTGKERVLADIDLTPELVAGYASYHGVRQRLTSKERKSDVLLLGTETETTTKKYYARNVRIVRVQDNKESGVESGKTAVFVGSNAYCQRLEPELPAW